MFYTYVNFLKTPSSNLTSIPVQWFKSISYYLSLNIATSQQFIHYEKGSMSPVISR